MVDVSLVTRGNALQDAPGIEPAEKRRPIFEKRTQARHRESCRTILKIQGGRPTKWKRIKVDAFRRTIWFGLIRYSSFALNKSIGDDMGGSANAWTEGNRRP